MVWPGSSRTFIQFKNILNTVWPTVKFEEEIEEEGMITFLDMKIIREKDNKLKYEFYQKDTHSGRYLHYSSHCSQSIKINIIKMEAARIRRNCMYESMKRIHGNIWAN